LIAKLEQTQYARLGEIFRELRYNLLIDSVIEGHTPAWVFANHPEKPTSGLVWNENDTLLLAGDTRDGDFKRDLNNVLIEQIIPSAQQRGVPTLALHYHPNGWAKEIPAILAPFKPERSVGRYYSFDRLNFNWRNRIPTGIQMEPMNRSLLQDATRSNLDQLIGWVYSFWRSLDDFLEYGRGYCLVREKEILSWCLSIYVSGNEIELGLETARPHRKEGFGTLVAAACVEDCVRNDITPHWQCWNQDLASITIAESIGFENPVKYPAFRLEVNPKDTA
jgi:GNAT superfamily N-acetyltransferase